MKLSKKRKNFQHRTQRSQRRNSCNQQIRRNNIERNKDGLEERNRNHKDLP